VNDSASVQEMVMRVDSIYLSNFRNYTEASTEFNPGINVIAGKNAQGKTNLLEAVYLITGGRSFRTRFDRELIRFEADAATVSARINASERDQDITIQLRRGLKKQIWQNGSKVNPAELSQSITAVLFCPDDLNIIKDGASERRRLMDMAISQLRPGYAALISEYNKIFEHKMHILKEHNEKPSLLYALDDFSEKLCQCSAQIIRYRAAFVKRLEEAAYLIHREFSGNNEELRISYRTVSSVTDPFQPAGEIFKEVMAHQAAHRQAELSSSSCLTGAHKDDLEIEINGVNARSFASQGQSRTAALSIKLAEREIHLKETGEYPVLLLDDVLSELDPMRQEYVLNRIGGGQTLITCCMEGQLSALCGGKVILIDEGHILPRGD
jgi:DNA replication and repair protein RecF